MRSAEVQTQRKPKENFVDEIVPLDASLLSLC